MVAGERLQGTGEWPPATRGLRAVGQAALVVYHPSSAPAARYTAPAAAPGGPGPPTSASTSSSEVQYSELSYDSSEL
jgi:hypothetical protein